MAYERGTVKFYDPRKKFGFIYVIDDIGNRSGEEVYFHLYDYRLVKHTLEGPTFGSRAEYRLDQRLPKPGEQLLFRRSSGKKGDKARPWVFADVWDKTVTYRVTVTTLITFEDKIHSESIVWEGSNTDELCRQFPPSDILGADPLFQLDLEDGWIRFKTRYQRFTQDGLWTYCGDPRYRITPVTELERAIDAENRQRWPGDYL